MARETPPSDFRILSDLLKDGAVIVRVWGTHHQLVFVDCGDTTYDIHGATVGSLRYRSLITRIAPPSMQHGERVERWQITAAGRRWVVQRAARLTKEHANGHANGNGTPANGLWKTLTGKRGG